MGQIMWIWCIFGCRRYRFCYHACASSGFELHGLVLGSLMLGLIWVSALLGDIGILLMVYTPKPYYNRLLSKERVIK